MVKTLWELRNHLWPVHCRLWNEVVQMKTYKGLNVIFHGGGDARYCAYFLHVPAYHFSVIVMDNRESFNPPALPYDILNLYLNEFERPICFARVGDRTFTFPYAPFSKLVFGPEGLRWHFSDFAYRCKKMFFEESPSTVYSIFEIIFIEVYQKGFPGWPPSWRDYLTS